MYSRAPASTSTDRPPVSPPSALPSASNLSHPPAGSATPPLLPSVSGARATKDVWFVRHGQAQHNVRNRYNIHDPELTPLGRAQAANVSAPQVDMIVVSPLKRTIQTALLAFAAPLAAGHIRLVPHPDLQETEDKPCDTGSDVAVLREMFPSVDFTGLPMDWNRKQGLYAAGAVAVRTRCARLRRWLGMQDAARIAVVGHGALFRVLLRAGRFANCEVRHYVLSGGVLELRRSAW